MCPPVCSGKRLSRALSSESDGSEQSDATIKGSDEDEDNPYQVVRRKAKRVTRRQKVSNQNINATQPLPMEVASLESPTSPDPSVGQTAISAPRQVCNDGKSIKTIGSKPSAPPRAKIPPPVCLRDKSRWNAVSAKYSGRRILYILAQNSKHGIKITTTIIDDFCELNNYLIKSDIPFYTFALKEEHKVKVVLKLYGHAAANCPAQPRWVKCLVYWTKYCDRSKETGGKPACCNCGQKHTANYEGCPEAPKPNKFLQRKNEFA
ncbi:hypothetical protein EVAR_65171_1 [Eumeta japonica]|uniref:Nucleic-acid-binding protein from transposon X-element n=1 Tax=Eumeta variegata TaxID=151549 RepID=A0A4C1ZIA3_EUMVA|nr:hypothetical protein EVAR_65171_1 [Eumeta japonica]